MLTVGFVLETLMGHRPEGSERPIISVVIDSRQARPGSLFIAFPGERVDGHDAHDEQCLGRVGTLERPEVQCLLAVDEVLRDEDEDRSCDCADGVLQKCDLISQFLVFPNNDNAAHQIGMSV